MAEQLRRRSDADLDRALVDLGSRLAYPPTPDLAGAVRARLTTAPAGRVLPRRSERAARRPWPLSMPQMVAMAAVALLLLGFGALALFPGARVAVADRLGLRGVRIFFVEVVPTPGPTPAPVGRGLRLGRRVALGEAREAVPFPVRVPDLAGLGAPDEVYLTQSVPDGMVSLVYRAGPGLPASPYTGVGALLTQFRGETDRDLVEKGLFGKGVPAGTRLEPLKVNGGRGYWIEGGPHSFFVYRAPDGDLEDEEFRLAGNVLLWEQDGLTFRLEAAVPKEEALRIAASVPPSE